MKSRYKILAINPGSTSTKIAVYHGENSLFIESLTHSANEISKFPRISDQYEFRKELIIKTVFKHGIALEEIDAIVSRGGNMKPVEGGTYEINQAMVEDLRIGVMGQHASNLGGIIAYSISKEVGKPSYVVDPVVVDEFEEYARISGIPEIERRPKDHPLNQKAAARLAAKDLDGDYGNMDFIVAHLGGGASIGAHKKGKIIDVNNVLDGDGPFSPERSGGLPVGSLVDM